MHSRATKIVGGSRGERGDRERGSGIICEQSFSSSLFDFLCLSLIITSLLLATPWQEEVREDGGSPIHERFYERFYGLRGARC